MARVKLRCIMGCPGIKRSYQEKGLLSRFHHGIYFATNINLAIYSIFAILWKKSGHQLKTYAYIRALKNLFIPLVKWG